MSNSFKQIFRDKVIKRNDSGILLRWTDITINPSFRKREDDDLTRAGMALEEESDGAGSANEDDHEQRQ